MENFLFRGFEAEDFLRAKAYRMIDRLVEMAPKDARISGILDRDGERFRCTVEISSRIWPAVASLTHKSASIAIDKVELALTRRLPAGAGMATLPIIDPTRREAGVISA